MKISEKFDLVMSMILEGENLSLRFVILEDNTAKELETYLPDKLFKRTMCAADSVWPRSSHVLPD